MGRHFWDTTLDPASPESPAREAIRDRALEAGADLVGFASVAALERLAPPEKRPSTFADGMSTLVVFGKRMLGGIGWSRHVPNRQLAGGRILRALDRVSSRVAEAIEPLGATALPVATGMLDFDRRGADDATPAGQGSLLLRLAAVEAGLGTWGLNTMVLTPEFGPRVFFGGLLVDLQLEPDAPLEEELCLGLEECGRCAAICPEKAIPCRAPVGADLARIRGLDCEACSRSSQPFGFGALGDFTAYVLDGESREIRWQRLLERSVIEIYNEMTMMKESSLTGCTHCLDVCPVGRDYERIAASPHRRADLPDEIPKTHDGDFIEVVHLGPGEARTFTWNRPQTH